MKSATNILRIDASANVSTSNSMKLGDKLIDSLSSDSQIRLTQRNLNDGLSFIDETWVGANFTAADERSEA